MIKIERSKILILCAFAVGVLWAFSLRFLLAADTSTHYHANFAVYVDGTKDPFDNFTFYEEVTACNPEYINEPTSRAHLHDNISHIIHVHDTAVTWGHFFANLEYSISKDALQTDDGIFIDGQDGKQLRFILNGKEVGDVTNKLIESEDTLLVDYGADNIESLLLRYADIPEEAAEYNLQQDPAACSGSHEDSFWARVKRTLGVE